MLHSHGYSDDVPCGCGRLAEMVPSTSDTISQPHGFVLYTTGHKALVKVDNVLYPGIDTKSLSTRSQDIVVLALFECWISNTALISSLPRTQEVMGSSVDYSQVQQSPQLIGLPHQIIKRYTKRTHYELSDTGRFSRS